ncbi:hypothetical protein F4825DRAFT_448949 [Nemania diffusa]|nr:hypothetical protein F4825DRAFT_448949 [Nemania diffusa]
MASSFISFSRKLFVRQQHRHSPRHTTYMPIKNPNNTSTRILQSLLATTLICIVANWYLIRNAIVLPRSPTTIGNWMAFLGDGNLDDYLPVNAAQMQLKDLSRWYFGQNARFYFGYTKSPKSGDQVFGIYVTKEAPEAI